MSFGKFLVASNGGVSVYAAKCGHIDTNVGFIENVERSEAVLIDASFGSFAASKKILSHGTKVIAVFFTHGHWDHIGDGHIFRNLGATTHAHGKDRAFIERPQLMAMFAGIEDELVPCGIDVDVEDGDEVSVGGWLRVSCRWVPGHAAGDLVFYLEDLGCAFTGDTLFAGCIGRTDLPGGDEQLLIDGIKRKILTLPNDITVIPGHGRHTTVGYEKANNEFFA
ncbi:MAG: MBL fold metallo-hydrolase [Puniceicoccales bacterium]|jgi:glyoxylase-like metal-dependent hydrolase (beta-lactamase superfamily II)|nr:MBL fold metallo-hydrolase [Puniceicoccales bacterium]